LQPSDINILVVDDDNGLRESLTLFFKALKFTTFAAKSGNEAIGVIKQNPSIQIVLSDIRMADGNGIDFLKEVRKSFHRELKFFLMTGFDDLTLENAYAYGVDGFFSKPFSIGTVRDCIQQSFLKKNHLWSRRPANSDITVKRNYPGFLSMCQANDISFGRSGVFFAMKFDQPRLGDMCSFQIELKDLKPCRVIAGFGVVRWVRKEAVGDLPAGIGVEIIYLSQDCREHLIEFMDAKSDPATIPLK